MSGGGAPQPGLTAPSRREIASAAARMVSAAGSRPIIEMGSRRTHERAAVASARAAYIAGVAATSNLEAARSFGVPSAGTAAHAFTLGFTGPDGPDEKAAFAAQIETLGVGTTLLVDTFDITQGVRNAVEVAGPELGAVRIDSGDLGVLARQVREQLDELDRKAQEVAEDPDADVDPKGGLFDDAGNLTGDLDSDVDGDDADYDPGFPDRGE